ncbi:DUF6493 family protein [Mucilaginibacter flavidus]|uniref:DUF6493 family protein n=1 Tax=Mucilaginibacter flavidus TaxID=2949309 RepID=UPI002092A200|nr:DUF6493 family protein [Mucilaginibacter flavidus]MCO5948779.1 DUF6493 family protein [Mucilaginibacter flavidus]
MTITEQFTQIVERQKEKELLPFLKTLDSKQKKELTPLIKKLDKYYSAYEEKGSLMGSYSRRGKPEQMQILNIASFVCFNLKDFERTWAWSIFNREVIGEILTWYCPSWLTEYAIKHAEGGFIRSLFDYRWYMELVEKGYVMETDRLTVLALQDFIFFEQSGKNRQYRYVPEALLERDVTLKEHIWLFFKVESGIHNIEEYKQFSDDSKPERWINTFKLYVSQGRIDRSRLLNDSLVAAMGGYNQSLSNWFLKLFVAFEPTKTELQNFTGELLNILNSANSKPVNIALNYLKELAAEPEFPIDAFLEHAPLVLTSETKSAVTSALMILEKLAKVYPDRGEEICIAACQAFIHQDEKIQVRVAKMLQKYGDGASTGISDNLAIYKDNLLLEAKTMLKGFSEQTDNAEVASEEQETLTTSSLTLEPITYPENFDDFVFLASQAFDQNETYHFDMLPAAILKFQDEMTEANIAKLLPAFQRAYKMVTSDWRSGMGYLDDMLAKFFMDYGQLLVKFYPKEGRKLKEMRDSFEKMEAEKKAKSDWYKIKISGIKPWDVFTRSPGYKPHKHILLNAIFMLERKLKLPMLSTPTHEPCYVSSLVLVQRLIMYQEARVTPGDMDFEVAIARCIKMDIEDTLHLANERLKGERRHLISFIFGGEYSPMDSNKSKPAWLVAAMVHNSGTIDKRWFGYSKLTEQYLRAEFTWKSGKQEYFYDKWDHELRKNIKTKGYRSRVEIDFGQKEKQLSGIKKIFAKIMPGQEDIEPSVYDYTQLKFEYITAEHNDIKRLLTINPADRELLLAHIVNKCLKDPDFSGENDKRLIIYTLETLLAFAAPHRDIAHLLIATCMISNDKTVRTYAAELWIQGVSINSINSETIGKIIGTHERAELAPLKRFTDLVLASMYQISAKHNEHLAVMLGACILNMDVPVNNTKKLLDIYAEVLAVNKKNEKPDYELVAKLRDWRKLTEALDKSILKINQLLGVGNAS